MEHIDNNLCGVIPETVSSFGSEGGKCDRCLLVIDQLNMCLAHSGVSYQLNPIGD